MNREIDEYNIQLQRGDIQKAYRSIIGFMAKFRIYLKRKYPSHIISALYPGYMDMTYFSITPENLKKHNLKIASFIFTSQTPLRYGFPVSTEAFKPNTLKDYRIVN